jgi:Zn-dependent M28 family amino/carboxypeptidase
MSTFVNVIGFLDNRAPRTIVVGAHFDHLGLRKNGKIRYGADDNASGTAGMLELARYFSMHRDTLNNYLFIGFTAEEKGLWGSDYFIHYPTIPLSDIRLMLNLDMIGRLGCEGNQMEIEAVGSSPLWRQIIHNIPDAGFRIKCINASLPFSDHDAFYKAGIPVIFFNTGLHDDYHTITDKPHTLNYDGMVKIMQFAEYLLVTSNRNSVIPYHKVSFIPMASAWVGFLFQALGWALTIN